MQEINNEQHWPAASESQFSCCKHRWTLQEWVPRRCPCQSPTTLLSEGLLLFQPQCILTKEYQPRRESFCFYFCHLKDWLAADLKQLFRSLLSARNCLRVPVLVVPDHTLRLILLGIDLVPGSITLSTFVNALVKLTITVFVEGYAVSRLIF